MKQIIKTFINNNISYTIYFETCFDKKYIRVYKDWKIVSEYDLALEELTEDDVQKIIEAAEKNINLGYYKEKLDHRQF